jgi:hypothetical protein
MITTVTSKLADELDRRRRAELRRSLDHPHTDSAELAEQGLAEWWRGLPEEDAGELVGGVGNQIHWVPGKGWIERRS